MMKTTQAAANAGIDAGRPLSGLAPVLTESLIRRMDVPGPRYTSYPTADRFGDGFSAAEYKQALALRRADPAGQRPLSLYVHVPFCESVCYYCACNKVVTRDHDRSGPYLDMLTREMDLIVQHLGTDEVVTQLHFGGGTPTFLTDDELGRLMGDIRSRFTLAEDGEYSIEVDPRTVTADRLAHLRQLGFNRLSFGVQDFDLAVQQAVHRVQPFEQVADLMQAARRLGFSSINADLIYGLPRQTPESFDRTVKQVASLRPDRIALYGYAHLPTRFKPQRRIAIEELPRPEGRVSMLSQGLAGFVSHGYDYIGMDHFALPDDPLAIAKREGKLHRNFQGYSTQADCDLIGLGVSSISRVGGCFSQSAKTVEAYAAALESGELPVVRGLALNADDVIRQAVIMDIMCHGELDFDAVSRDHDINALVYFAREIESLESHQHEDLLALRSDGLRTVGFTVTPLGWYFIRSIAMAFDRYLQNQPGREGFSKVV